MGTLREDFTGQRQLRFRLAGQTLHLFKNKGESTHQVFLKILAFAFYQEYPGLTLDPRTNHKIQPTIAALDLTGEVLIWVQVGLLPLDKLEYVLRHTDAKEVCMVLEAASEGGDAEEELDRQVQDLAARIKKQIHYKYTARKLKILMFRPLETWFDPDEVDPHPTSYVFYSF